MNPIKETGREYVYGNFGIHDSSKSDGWHGDIEAILAEYEASSQSASKSKSDSQIELKSSCEKSR